MTHCTTKTIKNAYADYQNSNKYNLSDCYKNASYYKQNAMNYCRKLKYKYNGFYGKIIGFNCMQFSYGFIGTIDNIPAFFYITKDNDRYIYISELEK